MLTALKRAMPKVFCVGFPKTGTTSLDRALEALGYRVFDHTDRSFHDRPNIANEAATVALSIVPQYDAFRDTPWPMIYREMDAAFPGSRFILTVRPTKEWIESTVRFYRYLTPMPLTDWVFGTSQPIGNEEAFVARYERHTREVIAHFAGRDNLLVMRVSEGDGWSELCGFLDRPLPDIPFPHEIPPSVKRKPHWLRSPAARLLRRTGLLR